MSLLKKMMAKTYTEEQILDALNNIIDDGCGDVLEYVKSFCEDIDMDPENYPVKKAEYKIEVVYNNKNSPLEAFKKVIYRAISNIHEEHDCSILFYKINTDEQSKG